MNLINSLVIKWQMDKHIQTLEKVVAMAQYFSKNFTKYLEYFIMRKVRDNKLNLRIIEKIYVCVLISYCRVASQRKIMLWD